MEELPVRGGGVRALGFPLPPARMPLLNRGRPLKRWRYVGLFGPDWMLCAGSARVAGLPRRWWALALPDGSLREWSGRRDGGLALERGHVGIAAEGVSIDLRLPEGDGVEVVSPHGRSWIWTRKQAGLRPAGTAMLDGRELPLERSEAFVDESAGYHARRTAWRWSAGVGHAEGGERVAWNLVAGVHDAEPASERTVWIDGVPHEVGPVSFDRELTRVGDLRFRQWATREEHTNLLLFRSDYRQPFGSFSGSIPSGARLVGGWGVMEEHDVRW